LFGEEKKMSDSSGNPISYYVDDIKDSWKSLRLYIFPQNLAASDSDGGLASTAQQPQTELDALAKGNEELRDRCINIINRTDDLLALRNEFIEVFGDVGKILKNTETTNSTLAERSAKLALEEEEHNSLKQRHRALHEENETHRNDNSVLRSEVQRHEALIASREARIEALETDLATEKDGAAALRTAVEQERFIANLATEKLQLALAEIDRSKAVAEALQIESAAANDRSSKAEFHARALQDSLAEAQGEARQLRDALADSQQRSGALEQSLEAAGIEIDGFRKRGEALEAALSAAQLEHEMAQLLWGRRAEESRDEIAALRTQLDADSSRAEATEQLLADARAELIGRVVDLNAKERRIEQLEASIAPLSERCEQAKTEIADLVAKIAEAEKSHAKLADRAQALVRAMNDKTAKFESAEERIHLLNKRLADDSVKFAVASEQFEQKISELTAQLEREKNARIVVSGALEASRTRAARPRPAMSMREILARSDVSDVGEAEYLLPWSERPVSRRSDAAPNMSPLEPSPAIAPAKPAGKAKPAMPRTKMLVTPREGRRNAGELADASPSASFARKRQG
jgi:chromosome segregation ATPase